ncbi:putative dioxygenase [Chytriomyces sp. MP71]|nr:putative dioxygenase [Chytriomyces sp. MP71]
MLGKRMIRQTQIGALSSTAQAYAARRLRTKLTEAVGIEHPIVQVCGMQWVGTAEMAAAVSNAGGLGIVTALTQPTPEALYKEIQRCRSLTDKPFGVNLTILPAITPPPYEEYVAAMIDQKVKVVETAGNNPSKHTTRIKELSPETVVIHKCTTIRHALSAQKTGTIDFVSIDGFECAGHPGEDDVGGLVLLALAARKLDIPFLASGGIGDGRGLAAALALGAEGVNMGTRFMATQEAPIHENVKKQMVQSKEVDTVHLFRTMRNTARFYKNSVAVQALEIERTEGSKFSDIQHLVSGKRGKKVFEDGDLEAGVWTAGQVLGLIDSVPTCQELLRTMVDDAIAIIENSKRMVV